MSKSFPSISIVTPNFNMGRYLEETILSVISQNYPELEFIIIDGGSTDNSLDIIKKYENKLTYWISEPDEGMYHAIQKGFEHSTGEIMAWINSDDKYHPGAFSIISEIFATYENVNWLTGSGTYYDERGRSVNIAQSRRWSKFDYYTGNYRFIQQESTFWRRSLWEKSGGKLNLEVLYAADFELWLRFFRFEKLFNTSSLIGGFRVRKNNQISLDSFDAYITEVEELLKSEKLSEQEQKIIRIQGFINAINKWLSKIKLNSVGRILRSLPNKYLIKHFYDYPPAIEFDSIHQEYILKYNSDK